MPIVHNSLPALHPPSRVPYARMARAARILDSHREQLQATGEAAYVVHRHELNGRPYNFLQAIRRVVGPQGSAAWWEPWGRGMVANVLLVQMVSRTGLKAFLPGREPTSRLGVSCGNTPEDQRAAHRAG